MKKFNQKYLAALSVICILSTAPVSAVTVTSLVVTYSCDAQSGGCPAPATSFNVRCTNGTTTWNGSGSFSSVSSQSQNASVSFAALNLSGTVSCSMTSPASCTRTVSSSAPVITLVRTGYGSMCNGLF